jgi:hypothetical protein
VAEIDQEEVPQLDGIQELSLQEEVKINSLIEENARLMHDNEQLRI